MRNFFLILRCFPFSLSLTSVGALFFGVRIGGLLVSTKIVKKHMQLRGYLRPDNAGFLTYPDRNLYILGDGLLTCPGRDNTVFEHIN